MADIWERCPRCGAAKVSREFDTKTVGMMVVLGVLAMGFSYAWLGWFFVGAALIFLAVVGGVSKRHTLECKDCQYKWDARTQTPGAPTEDR